MNRVAELLPTFHHADCGRGTGIIPAYNNRPLRYGNDTDAEKAT